MTGGHGFVVQGDRDRWTHGSGRKPLLERLDVELTERCDSDCIHCYINLPAGDPRARVRELPAGEWMRIFREAAELGALTIRMTGGEPLLRDDFAELYLYARRLGLKVSLCTNARRVTPELADLLARVPPLERIEVTVYGMREETYEAVTRVPGSYAGFRRGVALLLERKIPFEVKGALLPPNRGEIDEFEAWAATLRGWNDPPPVRCSSTCAPAGTRRRKIAGSPRCGSPRRRGWRSSPGSRKATAGRWRGSAPGSRVRPATGCSRAVRAKAVAWTHTAPFSRACSFATRVSRTT
ncbi:MAG: radical SAM protein [Deltaproteobacteria bacterium]|nr:MAG: radical SAM protein [Deltaproteobacteria bacterium]